MLTVVSITTRQRQCILRNFAQLLRIRQRQSNSDENYYVKVIAVLSLKEQQILRTLFSRNLSTYIRVAAVVLNVTQ